MQKFRYTAIGPDGAKVKGDIESDSIEKARISLRKKRIRVLDIKKAPIEINLSFGSGVKLKDMARFTRQFGSMTQAGLPLVQCLDVLCEQTENKVLSASIGKVSSDIQGGANLSDAMRKHPKLFNDLYCNMIAAGEASGNLDGVLDRLATYQEKADALRRKIQGAMMYPVIVLLVAVGVTAALLVFVIPTFEKMFSDVGGTLPAPTRVVITISDFLRSPTMGIIFGASIAGLLIFLRLRKSNDNVRMLSDKALLKIPILGELQRKGAVSRFSQTLSTLLNSGVTIIDALTVTAATSGNMVLEKGLMRTVERITAGQSISEPLKETGIFPPMVIHMIAVGERTGGLAEMLEKIAIFYEEEVDAAVEALTSIIEPLLIVGIGIVIGGILVAMYMPMFEMFNTIQ